MPRQVRKSADSGFARHAASSVWMYTVSSPGATEWGSRQGTGGSTSRRGCSRVAVLGTKAVDIRLLRQHRFGFEHEFRVAEGAHFRDVKAGELNLRRDSMPPDGF